jgi:hypothetical protein
VPIDGFARWASGRRSAAGYVVPAVPIVVGTVVVGTVVVGTVVEIGELVGVVVGMEVVGG